MRTRTLARALIAICSATGLSMIATPASAQEHSDTLEVDSIGDMYTVTVRASEQGAHTLTFGSGTELALDTIPRACMPGSVLFDEVLNVEDSAPEMPPLTRSVLVCELGELRIDDQRAVTFPIRDLGADAAPMSALLQYGDDAVAEQHWQHRPLTVCAPADESPTFLPGEIGYRTVDSRADHRIIGKFHPGSALRLTGNDMCERHIDRNVHAGPDGHFAFTGLLPGRYALLDASGTVLVHTDLRSGDSDTGIDLLSN